MTKGKSPEEIEKTIKEYLDIRNHELLKNNSENISYSHTSDLNTLSFRIFSMTK
jgi:hypothetical protein